MEREEFQKAYGKIVAKAWSDEAFKAKLLADPAAALKESGIDVPKGVEVRVVENTASVFHFILPPSPAEELTDEDLDKVAGGGCTGPFCQLTTGRLSVR